MKLWVLGSGTLEQSVERGCAGYLLMTKGKIFLLDAGPGTHRQLSRMKIDLASIDSIFITHHHVDHVNDLPAILFSMKYAESSRQRTDITIHGPAGFRASFEALRDAYGTQMISDHYKITVEEHSIPGEEKETENEGLIDEFEFGSIKISTAPMKHGIPSIGYRFDAGDGKSFTYSGDTEPCHSIIKLAKGGTCLLMEASTPDDVHKNGHTSLFQAAAIAKKAGVKTLLITHISPESDTTDIEIKASQYFDGITIACKDGMRLTI